MAVPSTPTNVIVYQGNGTVSVSCALVSTATSYQVLRSTDGVTFTTVGTPTVPRYLDTAVSIGTIYYYSMVATNGTGNSPASKAIPVCPSPTGEMSLMEIRYRAKERADRVNGNFVTGAEWNSYINQSLLELYDLLVTVYEDYFMAPMVTFNTDGSTYLYPLPNGVLSFIGPSGSSITAAPFHKLLGVDLAINNAANGFVTMDKFNYADRNMFVYPNSTSTIYGVFNMRYRIMGNNMEFIPVPSANQQIRLSYIPRLQPLVQDNDITTIGGTGWLEYVIVDAAIKALQKEESDTSALMAQKMALKQRIEESAVNRDAGRPDTISDVRTGLWGDGQGNGWNGKGGW